MTYNKEKKHLQVTYKIRHQACSSLFKQICIFTKTVLGTSKGVLWFIYYKHNDTVNAKETNVSCLDKFKMCIFNNSAAL